MHANLAPKSRHWIIKFGPGSKLLVSIHKTSSTTMQQQLNEDVEESSETEGAPNEVVEPQLWTSNL